MPSQIKTPDNQQDLKRFLEEEFSKHGVDKPSDKAELAIKETHASIARNFPKASRNNL